MNLARRRLLLGLGAWSVGAAMSGCDRAQLECPEPASGPQPEPSPAPQPGAVEASADGFDPGLSELYLARLEQRVVDARVARKKQVDPEQGQSECPDRDQSDFDTSPRKALAEEGTGADAERKQCQ